jgi:hypothetical protein
VILPVDFEEAWKVSCLFLLGYGLVILKKTQSPCFFPPQQTVKRSDETHEFCRAFTYILISACAYLVIQIGSWFVHWSCSTYFDYSHQLMLSSVPFRCTVSYMGNFIYFDFRSNLFFNHHHALLTLASFRIFLTDWRSFKRAKANMSLFVSFTSDAYMAGHVLIIIDYLIGMETKLMNVIYA